MECPSEQEVTINNWHIPPTTRRQGHQLHVYDDIMDHLTSVLPTTQRNFIYGDFNIHVDNVQDNDALASQ